MAFRLCTMKGTELIPPPSAIQTFFHPPPPSSRRIRQETKKQNHETPPSGQSVPGHTSGLAHISKWGTTASFPIYCRSLHSIHPAHSELPTHSIHNNKLHQVFIFLLQKSRNTSKFWAPKKVTWPNPHWGGGAHK